MLSIVTDFLVTTYLSSNYVCYAIPIVAQMFKTTAKQIAEVYWGILYNYATHLCMNKHHWKTHVDNGFHEAFLTYFEKNEVKERYPLGKKDTYCK